MRGPWTIHSGYGPSPEEADSFGWTCFLIGLALGVIATVLAQ